VLKADFNLTDAFHIFDPHHRGVVDAHDLRAGLNAIGVHPTSDQLELWIGRYDDNSDRRLSFKEFAAAFTPLDSYHAHMLQRRASNHRVPSGRRDNCFFADTAAQQRAVWNVHFRTEDSAETTRQHMGRSPYFNAFEAFNSLDLTGTGEIAPPDVRRMLESRGFFCTDKEIKDVVNKFDRDGNGRISLNEFSREMRPKSPVRH